MIRSVPPARREAWLRAGVIAGALLVAALIGLRADNRLSMLPGLAVLGLLGLLALLRYLPWGVIALIPISFLVDLQIKTGTNIAFNATFMFVLLLIGVWLLRMLAIERQVRLAPSPANLPALLFVAAGALAWLTSFLPWLPAASGRPSLPAQAGAFLIYALSIGAFLLAANILTTRRLIQVFTWTFIAFGIVYLFAQVIPWNFEFVVRWFVDAHYGSSVFWTLLAALTMGQALFNRDLPRVLRSGLLGTAALIIVFGLLKRPEWISGWLPPLIAVVALVWLWNWRVGLALTVVGGVLLLSYTQDFYATRINTETQSWSSYSRFATWPIIFSLLKLNPLTGLGPAMYPFFTSLYSYLGYYIIFNTHNNFFDIALQMGLVGLGIFLWLVVVIFRMGWQVHSRSMDGFSRAYATAMLAGLAAVLISGTFADWFLPFLYNIGIPGFPASVFLWLFAGGLASLALIQQKEARDVRKAS